MPLPPLVHLLDPRPGSEARARPILDAVNIPLDELDERMHELPSRSQPILVAAEGALLDRTLALLLEADRTAARSATSWSYGGDGQGRLWSGNEFLLSLLPELAPGRACDLACGAGRDAVTLAGHGWDVDAIDILPDALEKGRDLAVRYLTSEAAMISWIRKDLAREAHSFASYDLVTMFAFLDRDLVRQTAHEMRTNGSIVVETFTATHRARFGKPRDRFVLQPDELRALVEPLEVVSYDEGWHGERHTARLWAQKRAAR